MNKFFCSVGKNLAENLQKPKTSFSDYMRKPQIKRSTITPFSETLVTEIVKRLNKHKSPRPDGISNRIFSLSIEHIKIPLRDRPFSFLGTQAERSYENLQKTFITHKIAINIFRTPSKSG